jgi:hypothetical protein
MSTYDSSKPVVLYSASRRSKFFTKKIIASFAAVAVIGVGVVSTVVPSTTYAWAPQPYCRNGQTVMVSYNETEQHYNTQSGDVAGACPSPSASPTASPTPSASPSPTATPCVVTDLKGTFNHSDNHFAGKPVTGSIQNVSTNSSCPTTVWVSIYGSTHTQPEGTGWLESQKFISQQAFDVPAGQTKNISIDVPSNSSICIYQIDMLRTSEKRVPPVFNGTDMIDYAFAKDEAACATPAPTATASPNVTIINNNNVTVVNASPSSSPAVIAASTTTAQELPKTGLPLAGVALGGLTPLGMKLKKFKSAKEAMSANFIWEKRELSK